jgi:D-beta-D-heptose 7-phosphate kinase/D-beta-D-heptose 1-phosphate adenosyltransferase
MRKIGVIVSGYFNPLHIGHLEYFKKSKTLGDFLFVIVNNDLQRKLKGSKIFMNQDERVEIISNLRLVDKTILSIDKDKSVKKTIELIYNKYYQDFDLIFTNGGDQENTTSPEMDICKKLNIKIVDGMGKKIQSSSWLLKN